MHLQFHADYKEDILNLIPVDSLNVFWYEEMS